MQCFVLEWGIQTNYNQLILVSLLISSLYSLAYVVWLQHRKIKRRRKRQNKCLIKQLDTILGQIQKSYNNKFLQLMDKFFQIQRHKCYIAWNLRWGFFCVSIQLQPDREKCLRLGLSYMRNFCVFVLIFHIHTHTHTHIYIHVYVWFSNPSLIWIDILRFSL